MANVFMSFLGTSNYKKVKYYYEDKRNSCLTEFVQKALIEIFCKNWSESDKIMIFMTSEARERHGATLKKELKELQYASMIEFIDIDTPKDENSMWTLFKSLFDSVAKNDAIYFDVTHAFRFLPMLACYFLNSAKIQKDISVEKICYGALEAVGTPQEIEAKPEAERYVPIIDLSFFDHLFNCTLAADQFIKSGNSKALTKIESDRLKEDKNSLILRTKDNNTKNFNKNDKREFNLKRDLSELIHCIDKFSKSMSVCNIDEALSAIEDLKKIDPDCSSLEPKYLFLINAIKSTKKELLSGFNNLANNYGLLISWCLKHQQVQQAVTVARESLAGYLLNIVQRNGVVLPNFYLEKEKARELMSSALSLYCIEKRGIDIVYKDENEKQKDELIREKIYPVIQNINIPYLLYEPLTKIRNSINHANNGKNLYYNINGILQQIIDYFEQQ